ncbi:low temperature requirement A protein (LtrA) [Actinopolyspora mzabensis]|uniref:Low temperature requirement A protein (LtrA) n=1 Tax=Actinopolyspora mzabensis TaxID=995066 RepID=A0A1G8Z6B1_ACTMZ|nr:low temperature requirement A protein (LtrA) [Actinopolyspora mzabensis]
MGAQVGRAVFMAVALRGHVLGKNYTNLLAWSASACVLWLVGAFLDPTARLVVWLVALVVDVAAQRFEFRFPGLGTAPMHTWPTDPEHLAERNRGVFIIALGESILIVGFTLPEPEPITVRAIVATLLGFVGLFVLWWAYFALVGQDTQTSRGDASTSALRSAFACAHALMVAGAIVVAVSIELRIGHAEADPAVVLTTVGGPLAYLGGNILFLRSRTGSVARARCVAATALVAVGVLGLVVGHTIPSLVVGLATVAIMGTLAVVTQLTSKSSSPETAA